MAESVVEKKSKKGIEKIVRHAYKFLSSWWSIVFHALWFAAWLLFDFNTEILILGVSLEAIFIWLFFLMEETKARRIGEEHLRQLKEIEKKMVEEDIKIDERTSRRLSEIKTMQKLLQEQMATVTRELKKLQEE